MGLRSSTRKTTRGTAFLTVKGHLWRPCTGLVSNGQLLFVGQSPSPRARAATGRNTGFTIPTTTRLAAGATIASPPPATAACRSTKTMDSHDSGRHRDVLHRPTLTRPPPPKQRGHDVDLWGYSTLNATLWHMTNLTATSTRWKLQHRRPSAHIKLAMVRQRRFRHLLINGSSEFPPMSRTSIRPPTTGSGNHLCSSCGNSQGTSGMDAQTNACSACTETRSTLPVRGPARLQRGGSTAASQIIPGTAVALPQRRPRSLRLNTPWPTTAATGRPYLANGQRNTLLQWAPETETVSDAWNRTPFQRIDGPITGSKRHSSPVRALVSRT